MILVTCDIMIYVEGLFGKYPDKMYYKLCIKVSDYLNGSLSKYCPLASIQWF